MKNPYLIQRAKALTEKREGKKGIDQLLKFDYMGSAEFEWGALPKSLGRIRDQKKEYVFFQQTMKGSDKVVNVFCKKEDKEEIPEYLQKIAKKEARLKEFCDLGDWVYEKDQRFHHNPSDAWWDLDNDLFFWKSELPNDFDKEFQELLFKK